MIVEPPLVLLLNGAPGVGKSTLARRWAAARPGTWLLDIDQLRTLVSGWEDDFAATGALARPVALAMITAAARAGDSVVVPQLLADPVERDRFRAAAEAGGARWVEVLLVANAEQTAARLAQRPLDRPWLRAIGALLDADPAQTSAYATRLAGLAGQTPDLVVLDTGGLDEGSAHAALEARLTAIYDGLSADVAERG